MANNKMALGSRPQEQYAKKLVGKVLVKTGQEKAKLILQEEDGRTFANGTDTLTVSLSDLPKFPKLQPNDKVGKEYRVRMNTEGDEVEALTPLRGHFQAKLVDLGPRPEKDADPMPKDKIFDEGGPKEERHLEFFAVYEITTGAFKGVQLPAYWMHYKFEEDPDNEGYTRFAGNFKNKKATRLFQLRDWGMAHRLWEKDLPWDDDSILPELLERALDNDVEVEVNLSDGYILREGGVMPSELAGYVEPESDEDEIDEEFPPVKVKKSGRAQEIVDEIAPAAKDSEKRSAKPNSTTAKVYTTKAKQLKRSHADEDDDDL